MHLPLLRTMMGRQYPWAHFFSLRPAYGAHTYRRLTDIPDLVEAGVAYG